MKTLRRNTVFACVLICCALCLMCLSGCVLSLNKASNAVPQKENSAAKKEHDNGLVDAWDKSVSYRVVWEEFKEKSGSNLETSTSATGVDISVRYPQFKGIKSGHEESINQAIKKRAMTTVDRMYLNPSESMREVLAENRNADGGNFIGSTVEPTITYNDEDIISVAFDDHYFIGSIYLEFQDLRTININLQTGEVYHWTTDIMTPDEGFATTWRKRSISKDGISEFLKRLPQEDLLPILSNDKAYSNRYFSDFYINNSKEICIVVTYHLGDEQGIARGWQDAYFTYDELLPYKTASSFWDIPSLKDR